MYNPLVNELMSLNETTDSSAISFLPGGYSSINKALKTLAKMKDVWKIEVMESGGQHTIKFEDQLDIIVSNEHMEEFKEYVLDITELTEVNLAEHLTQMTVTEAVNRDSIKLVKRDIKESLLKIVNTPAFKKVDEDIRKWQSKFGVTRYATPKRVLVACENKKAACNSMLKTIEREYKDCRGYLEMLSEDLKNGTPLNEMDLFNKSKIFGGTRIISNYKGQVMTFEAAIQFNGALEESVLIEDWDVVDKVLENVRSVRNIKTLIFPVGGVFENSFFKDLKNAVNEVHEDIQNEEIKEQNKRKEQKQLERKSCKRIGRSKRRKDL